MKYKKFKALLESYQKILDGASAMLQFGVMCIAEGDNSIMLDIEKMFDITIQNAYNEKGCEWIDWFVYESNFGRNDLDASDNGKPICYDIKSLHQYVKQYENNN